MNKFLLIALVAGVALATNRREIYESTLSEEIETAYRAGSSYVYNYETQVVNGLPLTAPVYSIVKVKCKVIMEFKTASKVVMKIDGVTLHKLNGRVEAVDPTNEIVPDEVLVPITDDDTAIIERALTLPVKFRYTNGFVSGIVCESEDPEWSVNFKKGCLGLLQVNLEKSKLIEASEPVYTEDYSGVTVNEAYTVMETSPAGECACTYIVEENGGEAGEGKTIEVTKVRNFEDCLERPTFYHDNLGTKPCAKCDAVPKKPLEARSEVNMVLTGSREQFFIQTAICESSYILTTRERANGYAATFVNQTLEFVSSGGVRAAIPEPGVPEECPEGLKAIVGEVVRRDKMLIAEDSIPLTPREIREAEEETVRTEEESKMFIKEAIGALRAVAIDFAEGITEEGPSISMIAGDILRSGTYEELKTIWMKFNGPEEEVENIGLPMRRRTLIRERLVEEVEEVEMGPTEDGIRQTLWHLLPYVGTVPAVKVVCEAIREKHMPEYFINYHVFPLLAMGAEPVPEILELILSVAQSEEIHTRISRRSAWLCVGALLNRMDVTYTDKYEELRERVEKAQVILATEERGKPRRQLEEIAERTHMMKEAIAATVKSVTKVAIEALTELLKTSDEEGKIMALKTIGNAGIEEMMPEVVACIANGELPVIIRQQAVYSLRKIAEEIPKEVMEVLLPVFLDDDEDELVRIAAFTTILKCDPPAPYLYMIARSLDDEENPLVGSYVYTYLTGLSNTTYPCFRSLAVNASLAMKFATDIPEDVHSSYAIHRSANLEKYSLASAMELSVVGSRDSILPRGASFRSVASLLDYNFEFLDMGVETRGIQAILDKMIGPNGLITEGKSIFDVIRPKRSAFSSSEILENISRKLRMVERELEETGLDVFVNYAGNELGFYSLDSMTIKDLIEGGNIFTSMSEESLRTGYEIDVKICQPLGEIKTIIATEAGLPLTVHSHVAMMTAVTGTWKAEVQPSLFEAFRRGTKPTGLKAEMDIKPSCAADIVMAMGVDTAFYKTSAMLTNRAFVHNIQLTGTVEADFKMGKWFTSFETPTEEKKFGGLRSRPTTYFSKTNDHTLTEAMEVVVPEGGTIYPANIEPFSERNFGTVFAVRILKAIDPPVPGEVIFPMNGKQSFILFAKPDENPAERLNINFQVVSSGEAEEEAVEEVEEEERGVMGSILDTFWWGEDSEDSTNWDEDFDLREKDLSITAIAEQTGAPIVEGGKKNALALTIEGQGTSPPKELRVQCICQRTEDKKRNIVNFKATSTWTGRRKTTDVAFALNFHRGETTVRDLMSPEYQHMVKEHIKAASIIDPVTEETISRSNAWWVKDWQRIMTEIRRSGEPTSIITEEVVSPTLDSAERTIYERVEQIIAKQETIARRLADPSMQTMNAESGERIAERLIEIVQQAREVRREAERILASIRERAVGRARNKNIFIISLKVHRAIRHHKELLERVVTIVKTVTIRPSRRERIERIVNEELEGIERLFDDRRRIVDELSIPEEELVAPDVEINPEMAPSLTEISEVMDKQVEIAKEVQKVKNALKEGAERSSVIPQVKQILEHCQETVETIEGVTRELRGMEEAFETFLTPHMHVFKCLIQEDQLMFHIKEIVESIKYDPESPVEEVIAIGEYCEEHTVKLDALLGRELAAYDVVVAQTAMRASCVESVSELPVYMTAYMNLTYMTEGRRPWAMQIKIWGDKTLEQLIYETRQASERTRDPEVSRILELGEEAITEGTMRKIRKDINTLRKIKVEIAYSPELLEIQGTQRTFEWIETYIKAMGLWHLSYGVVNVTSPPGVAKVDLQFSRSGETVSSAIITPRMTSKFWDLRASPYLPAGVSVMERERGIFGIMGPRLRTEPGACYYRSENVETFDGRIYRLPEARECEKVLAMDCSPEKSFAVLLREKGPEKVIRVIVEKQEIEIIHRSTVPELKINGAVRRLEEEEPLIIRGEGEYASRPIVLRIERTEKETVIRAARRGIAVRLMPEAVRIEASPFFRSKICGMCGNFDGQWRREFEDPARRVHAMPESFGVSYLVPHETCAREELESRYPPNFISRPEGCIPIRRNIVRERRRVGGKVMCISTVPLRRCPIGCEPEGEIRKNVGFHCLPGEDPSVRKLVAESERRILEEVESRETDRWETIMEPGECTRT